MVGTNYQFLHPQQHMPVFNTPPPTFGIIGVFIFAHRIRQKYLIAVFTFI